MDQNHGKLALFSWYCLKNRDNPGSFGAFPRMSEYFAKRSLLLPRICATGIKRLVQVHVLYGIT
jgi:hypothetical protein